MKFTGTKDYVATDDLKIAVNASIVLERPLLIKGEPGTGKTVLAEEVAKALGAPLLTWHIKSTTKAQQGLYEYDAVSRLRDSQLGDARVSDISNYIKRGKLWEAFTHEQRPVLLIDEIDKADIEFPNDLLLELDRMEFFVYETGENIKAKLRPIVMITSNNEKELPDAFLRRCFFHYIKFPDVDTMNRIVDVHFPGIKKRLVEEALRIFFEVREVPGLKKKPSTSELLDWLKLLLNEDMTPEMLQGARPAQADPAAARRAAEERAGRAPVRAAGVFEPARGVRRIRSLERGRLTHSVIAGFAPAIHGLFGATNRHYSKSLDHFVGALLEQQRHLKPNRLCGLEVYHHLELGWLLDRQIGGLCPFKYPVNVARCPAIDVREARPVEDQSARFHELSAAVDRRQPTLCGKICDQTAMRLGQRLESHDDRVRAVVERGKSLHNVLALAHVEQPKAPPPGLRALLKLLQLRRANRISHIQERRDARGRRRDLLEQFHALGFEFGLHPAKARDVAAWSREAIDQEQRLADDHDHGNAARRLLGRQRGWCAAGDDKVGAAADHLGNKAGVERGIAVC